MFLSRRRVLAGSGPAVVGVDRFAQLNRSGFSQNG